MDETRQRLIKCFRAVFPDLKELESARQERVAEWDSVAAITLVNVIEEEFALQIDYEEMANLTSFDEVLQHLNALQKAP